MSIDVSLHRVVEATAEARCAGSTNWVELTFTAVDGTQLCVTLFTDKPGELLDSLRQQEATS